MMNLLVSIFLASSFSFANQTRPSAPYNCRAAIIAGDDILEFTFQAPPIGEGGHGGAPFEFKSGEHFLGVIADGHWRGISWSRNGQLVAEAVTASKSFFSSGQAFIVYNPKNTNEQAYVTCDHPQLDDFPKE